jgi:hypothetical protein
MDQADVGKSLISAWVAPRNVMISNDEVAGFVGEYPDRLVGVGSVDISRPMEAVAEVRRCVTELGFRAIRVLPWLWEIPPSDRLFYPVYAACCELGIPFCTQIGHTGPLMSSEFGRPIYLDRVALDFPDLVIVAGHIGYPWTDEAIAVATKHVNVCIDTSAYTARRYPSQLIEYRKKNGRNKVLFGSNYPMITAAAAAHLLDLDFEQTTNALAIATTQAFGLKRSFGTMTKPLHAGQAAEAAVEAALLARMGFTGAQDIFEGPNGFFEVLGGSANNLALAEMGQDWGMSQLSVKYHASCHWTHGGIETIRQIQSRDGVDHATIASIEITVSPVALKTAGVVYPQVGLEGKFSIPYAAMNALVTGKTGIQGFTDEAVNNPDVRRLIEKTTVSTEDFQDWFFTRTVVRTVDGNIYRAELSVFQDLPDLEQKRIGVIKKFNELVRPLLGEEKTTQIRETILALESVKDVSNLNQSEGLQYLYELLITAVEDPMSTYTPEVWGNPASPNTSGDQQ